MDLSDERESTWPVGESNSSSPALSSSSIPPPPAEGVTFSANELSTAISELGWGILSWEIIPPVDNDSTTSAIIQLLEEGATSTVEVSETGWRVLSSVNLLSAANTSTNDRKEYKDLFFETLDNLLSAISPKFESRRIKLLLESLETISVRRGWEEEEG